MPKFYYKSLTLTYCGQGFVQHTATSVCLRNVRHNSLESYEIKMIGMKHINLLVILMLSYISLVGQGRIDGEYSSFDTGAELRTLVLEKENLFTSYSGVLGGHSSFISKGYYLIKMDTLLLFYDSLPYEYPPSSYTILTKSDTFVNQFGMDFKITEDHASIDISIVGPDGNPLPGCNVVFMSTTNKAVFAEISYKEGKVFESTEGKLIETIIISWLGHKSIWISMKEFWGFTSTLEVKLELDPFITYNNKYKIEKYIINNDKVTLTLLNKGGRKLAYRKKDY